MRLKIGLRNAMGLAGVLAFLLMTAAPSGFAYSSKEAKDKVEAAEKAFQNAQRADDRAEQAADDWTKKADQDIRNSQNAQKKREEANAAREKANQTGKQEDIKAAEKAENIAKGAEKKAQESKKAFETALQTFEKTKQDQEAAKAQVAPLIESAEKAVDGLPESSVKDKLKERIKKLKDELQQLAFAFPTKLDPEKVSISIAGTKETIGHVATLTLINHSDEAFFIRIPPTILASKTGKVQNYALTQTVETTLGPRETKAIPLTGICLDARVRPAGPEDKDELMLLDPETLDANWRTQLGGALAVKKTTRELQRKGVYKTPYSPQPEKERDTLDEWTTWLFVSILKGNPITKMDLKKKVYEKAGEITPEKKEKLDPGVNDLWYAIKLTGAEAKVFSEGTEKISATGEDELEALKKREKELEEEYKKALEEFQKAKEALEKRGRGVPMGTQVEVTPGPGGKKGKKKFEPQDELEKDFLDKLEAVKKKEAELQKAALAREATEKERKKTQAQKPPLPQPPVVKPPPVAGIVGAGQRVGPPQGPCGFFEKKLLRTVETEWRPKGGRDFAIPGRDPAVIVVWEKDIENEFQVTGHCPLPLGHSGEHVPVQKVYEKLKTITQEESYPPGTRRPKPPKGLGLPPK